MRKFFDNRANNMDNGPIIRSLLDLDFYKLTMMHLAWKYFRFVPVTYTFKNRTKSVNLRNFISLEDLRRELDAERALRFTPEGINYLRESRYIPRGMFCEEFLNFLQNLRLPEVLIKENEKDFSIEVSGTWAETILWETLILSVVNELYCRGVISAEGKSEVEVWSEGQSRLSEKIRILKLNPQIKFSDFGTRRRFSRLWQDNVLSRLVLEMPDQLLGTSNVWLAGKYNIRPIGTFAHEMYMVFSGIYRGTDDELKSSHNKVLQYWWQEYGEPLSIALTDTYGTDFFFRDFTREQALAWRGLRHDSGDPIVFGENAIAFYESHGIDPRAKVLVFSDGLDCETILKIHNHFKGRIQTIFGWGTNLTNDCGIKPLSLVVKVSRANGHGTVKLSDNLSKAMGSPEDIERFKKVFGHLATLDEPCRY